MISLRRRFTTLSTMSLEDCARRGTASRETGNGVQTVDLVLLQTGLADIERCG
jgi:hypothetical protein